MLLTNSAEGGTDGALVTGAATADGGDAFTIIDSSNTEITFASGVAAYKGTRGFHHAATSGVASFVGWQNVPESSTAVAVRFYFRFAALPAVENNVCNIRSTGGGTGLINILLGSDGTPRLGSDPSGVNPWSATGTLAVNTWYRIEVAITNPSTTTGTGTLRAYLGDTMTVVASLDLTGVNFGAGLTMGTCRFGRNKTGGGAWTFDFDDVAFQTGSATLIGVSPNSAGTVRSNSFEGGTNGSTITTGTSGGASGTAFDLVAVGANATRVWSNAQSAHGGMSALVSTSSAGTANNAQFVWNLANGCTQVAMRGYFYLPAFPTVAHQIMAVAATSGSYRATVYVTTAGQFRVDDVAGIKYTGPALATGTWYRVEMVVQRGTTTTDGSLQFAYYALDGTSALGTFSTAAANTGDTTVTYANVQFGRPGATPALTSSFYMDDVAAEEARTTFIGPWTSPLPATLDKLKLGAALVGLRVGPDVASKAYLGTTQVWP